MKLHYLPDIKLNVKMGGYSLVELMLAIVLFAVFFTAVVGGLIYGLEALRISGSRQKAIFLAEEGLEAVRNMRDNSFVSVSSGTHGLQISGGAWTFNGSSDITDDYERVVTVTDVDSNTKDILVSVSWDQSPTRAGSVVLNTRLTNWGRTVVVANSCSAYCVSLGSSYNGGFCRGSNGQCNNNMETYQSGGDLYCTGGASADTCCCFPTPNSCSAYCLSLGGYTVGNCRANAGQCTSNSEVNQSGGNSYCTGGASRDTCCCKP